jgi:hypothetical protein
VGGRSVTETTAGVGDADDGVHELALYERPSLDFAAQPTKNAVTVSRSPTVTRTRSSRRMCDMSHVPPGFAGVVGRARRARKLITAAGWAGASSG